MLAAVSQEKGEKLSSTPPPRFFFCGGLDKRSAICAKQIFSHSPRTAHCSTVLHTFPAIRQQNLSTTREALVGIYRIMCDELELRSRRKNCNALAMNKIASLTTKRLLQDQEILPLGPHFGGARKIHGNIFSSSSILKVGACHVGQTKNISLLLARICVSLFYVENC